VNRREFITLLGSAAAWPLMAQAQQPTSIVGLINGRSAQDAVRNVAAFRKGLDETGYVEGQNVMVEYHWLEGGAVMSAIVKRSLLRLGLSQRCLPITPP
jgi:putative ABC transport system substrate-binding protein